MRRYLYAYGAWLAFVLTAATIAAWWYKRVEEIGLREMAERLKEPEVTTASDNGSDTNNG